MAQNGGTHERLTPERGAEVFPDGLRAIAILAPMEESSATGTPEQDLHQPSEHVRSLRASGQSEGAVPCADWAEIPRIVLGEPLFFTE